MHRKHLTIMLGLPIAALLSAAVVFAVAAPVDLPVKNHAIVISPHKASYEMKMDSRKGNSDVSDVTGTLNFEWGDACDGWTIQQHMKLHFSYSSGEENDLNSDEISWEAKDGRSYTFNVIRTANGEETERYRGKATIDAKGKMTVAYKEPKAETRTMPKGTIFPTTHTMQLLEKAAADEKIFSRHIFDGLDEDGDSDASVFINKPQAKFETAGLDSSVASSPLLNHTAWPVHMTFFKTNTETGLPDYDMDFTLLDNGVVPKIRIDYGDFTVTGTLKTVEALPTSGC